MSTIVNTSHWPKNVGLRVGHLNVRHLTNKISDVSKIIYNNNNPFHIFGFTESWTSKRVKDATLSVPGYSIVRRNPKRPQETGIAIYIQHNILYKVRHDLSPPDIESIWIEIRTHDKSSDSLLLGFIYRHPKSNSLWFDNFSAMMDTFWLLNKEMLFLGDMNIDLIQSHSKWHNIINSYNLRQCVTVPTRVTSKTCTLIDHIYSSNVSSITEICVPPIGISDHNAICVTWMKKGFKIPKITHSVITFRSFKSFNLSGFQSDLQSAPFQNIYNFTNPDDALTFWTSTFLSVINKHIPLIQKRVKSKILPGWLTHDILHAMDKRDDLKKRGLFDEYKKERNTVKYMIRKSKRNFFQSLIKDKRNTAQICKAIRQLTKSCVQDEECNIPADIFNIHFSEIGNKLIVNKKKSFDSFDFKNLKSFCENKKIRTTFSIPLITTHEVNSYIKSLKDKNSFGFDGISSKILKLSLPHTTDSLTYLFNLCLSNNYYPSSFRYAKVIPLFKKGDKNDVNNYRPISLLSTISKPLERHIHCYLISFLGKYNLLHDNQSGFRRHHSCETALCRITNSWLQNINNSKAVGAVFIDLTKAFDLINHEILLHKLKLYGIDDNCALFFKSYLANRTQSVYLCNDISSKKCITRGVPQGSILGPLLFSIYINDLPLSIQNALCDLFADDTTIHYASHNINEIQFHLNKSMECIDTWCEANEMVVHPVKTESMLICTRQKKQKMKSTALNISYQGKIIRQVAKHKLLGVTIDQTISWIDHIKDVIKQVSSSVFQLSQIKHFLDIHCRRLFYFAFIQSRFGYCSAVWGKCAPSNLKPLKSLQKRAIKMIMLKKSTHSSPDNIYNELQILPLHSYIKYNTLILMHKIAQGICPSYLQSIIKFQTRQSGRAIVPKPKIDLFKTSLSYNGSTEWNMIPSEYRNISSISNFKQKIKHFIFDTLD